MPRLGVERNTLNEPLVRVVKDGELQERLLATARTGCARWATQPQRSQQTLHLPAARAPTTPTLRLRIARQKDAKSIAQSPALTVAARSIVGRAGIGIRAPNSGVTRASSRAARSP